MLILHAGVAVDAMWLVWIVSAAVYAVHFIGVVVCNLDIYAVYVGILSAITVRQTASQPCVTLAVCVAVCRC